MPRPVSVRRPNGTLCHQEEPRDVPASMTDEDYRRVKYARNHGHDIMYAEHAGASFHCWTYSDGDMVRLPTFATLEGLQQWAGRQRFAIIYVD